MRRIRSSVDSADCLELSHSVVQGRLIDPDMDISIWAAQCEDVSILEFCQKLNSSERNESVNFFF